MQDEAAPRSEEMQFVHQSKAKREKNQRSDEDSVSKHVTPNLQT